MKDTIHNIKPPYLLFLGDAKDYLAIKTAVGVSEWSNDKCIGELKFPECKSTTGLKDLSLSEAKDLGAKTLIIGVVNPGGVLPDSWIPTIINAIELGFDIASGMHVRLDSNPQIAEAAKKHEVKLFDVRYPPSNLKTGKGDKRSGRRILTVGTDCSIGKKYTALVMEREMLKNGFNATFRATGQTGILIAGSGIAIDAVPSDFISGAVEMISPNNDENHFDIIEGQGSLFHPSFAGVSLGLLHGAQPDWFIVCHEIGRQTMRNVNTPPPSIDDVIKHTIELGKLTNPDIKPLGIALNTKSMDNEKSLHEIGRLEEIYNLPATDPIKFGVDKFIQKLKTA